MGLATSLAAMFLSSIWLLCFMTSVSSQINAHSLDSLLQDYAYRALVRPRTGLVYDGVVPSNLTGIRVSAMRLRSGSLRKREVNAYKEFVIPKGLSVHPYVKRLVLVYQNLGNWSETYYPIEGYTHLAPVLGLLAYDASNLSAEGLPELDLSVSGKPISIKFSGLRKLSYGGSVPKCVSFDSNGSINFTSALPANGSCTAFRQGHFSVVVESNAISPSPLPAVSPPGGPKTSGKKSNKNNKTVWITVGSVVGGAVLLVLLGLFIVWAVRCARKKKVRRMEKSSEAGEALSLTTVGSSRAPFASATRTQPSIETQYVP